MWNKSASAIAVLAVWSAMPGVVCAQQTNLTAGSDASSSVKIDLPADSPVTLISASTDPSHGPASTSPPARILRCRW